MTTKPLQTARERIALCKAEGFDHLNLACLGLTHADLLQTDFAALTQLRYLDLTSNALTELPLGLSEMKHLRWLGLNFNQLRDAPGLDKLRHLERLYLRGNAITILPDMIGALSKLVELDLTGNPLEQLPTSMGHLKSLEIIALKVEALPADLRAVWERGQWQALREHLLAADVEGLSSFIASLELFDNAERRVSLRSFTHESGSEVGSLLELRLLIEANPSSLRGEVDTSEALGVDPTYSLGKLILVGSEGNGKTCLQERLRGLQPQPGNKSTPGMNRERLSLSFEGAVIDDATRKSRPGPQADIIDLQVWDMGGQEGYDYTNQMFFTPECICLAVINKTREKGIDGLKQWLERVWQRSGGTAAVIVVVTECDEVDTKEVSMLSFDPKLHPMVRRIIGVDSIRNLGIDALRQELAEIAKARPFARQWRMGWVEALYALHERSEAYLPLDAVRQVSAAHGITNRESQEDFIDTAHLVGSVLWRKDTEQGRNIVVLEPNWLSRAAVRLLKVSEGHQGLLSLPEVKQVLALPYEDGRPGCPESEHAKVVELMAINELAYHPRMANDPEGKEHWLLLTEMVNKTPPNDFDQRWEALSATRPAWTRRLVRFVFTGNRETKQFPEIIYLLIVRLRDYSLGRQDYTLARHWRGGLLIEKPEDTLGESSAARIEWQEGMLRIEVRCRYHDDLVEEIVRAINVDYLRIAHRAEMQVQILCGQACVAVERRGEGLLKLNAIKACLKRGYADVVCDSCDEMVSINRALVRSPHSPQSELLGEIKAAVERTEKKLDDFAYHLFETINSRHEQLVMQIQQGGLEVMKCFEGYAAEIVNGMVQRLADGEHEGPRVFSLVALDDKSWRKPGWTHQTIQVTAWCERCMLPLPIATNQLNLGVFTIDMPREWVLKAKKLLSFSADLAVSVAAIGMAGLTPAAAAAALSVKSMNDASKTLRALSDSVTSSPMNDELMKRAKDAPELSHFTQAGRSGYGVPLEDDLEVVRWLREEFRKHLEKSGGDKWAGMKPTTIGEPARIIWMHPESPKRFEAKPASH